MVCGLVRCRTGPVSARVVCPAVRLVDAFEALRVLAERRLHAAVVSVEKPAALVPRARGQRWLARGTAVKDLVGRLRGMLVKAGK